MTNPFLSISLTRLFGHEGGYVNDPRDPGGETNWGISKRTYPNLDIKGLTKDQATDIYYRDFWTPLNGEKLPSGVAYQLFDFAVNSGISRAIKSYQKVLGVTPDGNFGAVTLAASKTLPEIDQIILILAERLDFMRSLATWKTYGNGWSGRIATNLRYGVLDSYQNN